MNSKILFLLLSILYFNISLFAFYQPSDDEFLLMQKSKTTNPKLERKKPEVEKKKSPELEEKKETKETPKNNPKEKSKGDKEKFKGGRFGDRRF